MQQLPHNFEPDRAMKNSTFSPPPFTMPRPDLERVIYEESSSFKSSITAPFDYLHSIPSNNHNIRLALLHAFNEAFFQVKEARVLAEIGELVGTLHEASLLIDDIEDESDMRRGCPAAHTQFGHALTINSGNYMYFLALQKAACMLPKLASKPVCDYPRKCSGECDGSGEETDCTKSNDSSNSCAEECDHNQKRAIFLSVKDRVSTILMDEMLRIHLGQGQDLQWRANVATLCRDGVPHPEEYLRMAMDKTGGLLRLSVELLVVFSANSPNHPANAQATALANLIGIIYQIRDDYLNLVDPRYAKMKGFAGEDLVEGKISLPVLYALSSSSDSPVHRLLLRFPSSHDRICQPEMLQHALTYIKTCGALRFSYDLLQEYACKGQKMVAETGSPDAHKLSQILADLANVVVPDHDKEPG